MPDVLRTIDPPELERPWEGPFLAALKVTCVVSDACEAAGITRRTAYEWRKRSARFAQAWYEAKENGLDVLERHMFDRAKSKDTKAAIFLLTHHRPDVYGGNRGGGGKNAPMNFTLNIGGPVGELDVIEQDVKVIEAPRDTDGHEE